MENIFKNFQIEITQKVSEEVDKNIFVNKLNLNGNENREILLIKDSLLKSKISKNEDENSQEYLTKITSYSKSNGEFYSSALALNLSRLNRDKIVFVTDDIPAKDEFKEFFEENKIGEIITTTEFLYTLFLICDSEIFIQKRLLDLKSQYLIEFKSYQNRLESFKEKYNDKNYYFLDNLIGYIKEFNFDKVVNVSENRLPKGIKELVKELKSFILKTQEKNSLNYIFKEIDNYLKLIKEKKYYRL